MFKDFFDKVLIVDEDDSDSAEYREIGAGWFDDTNVGLLERIALACAGWRDGRRGLVEIEGGAARSSYLNALRAKALAEVVSLAQLRHARIKEAQDEIEQLATSIPLDEARFERLDAEMREAERLAAQAVTDGAGSEGEDDGDEGSAASTPSAYEARQRERELDRLRRSIANSRKRLASLRVQQAFLRDDGALKLTLLIERYRERAARYLRAADGCRRQPLCAEAQPPLIQEDAERIMSRALGGKAGADDTAPTAATTTPAPYAESDAASFDPTPDTEGEEAGR